MLMKAMENNFKNENEEIEIEHEIEIKSLNADKEYLTIELNEMNNKYTSLQQS